MKKVKSALEIAMEKTKDMPPTKGQSDIDEVERQKHIKAAASLGRSFLQEKIDREKIKENIYRYPVEYQQEASNAFLREVTSGMNLTNTPRILDVIAYLYDDENTKKACAEAEKAYNQFLQQKEERKAKFKENIEPSLQKKFAAKGLKGTAIKGFNIKKMEKWQELSSQIEEEFYNVIENFSRELLKEQK